MTGYKEMLEDLDINQDHLDYITNMVWVIEYYSDTYHKDKSSIDGLGVFASKELKKDDIIGIGTIDCKYKTTLGRYTNHSDNNNAKFYYLKNNDVIMIAEKNISKNEEILINYRDHTVRHEEYI
jgi:SET domain-containing protein